MTTSTIGPRHDFLDWLRVIAISVLLFFHTGMLFVGWGWHITNAETIPALQWPMDLAHRLRMPLLFVIAGAGMWYALQHRSPARVARERTLRLLVPAVAGMFLIVPPQIYVERLADGDWHGGYLSFMFERVLRLDPYPAGDFGWHHLWFIVYLFVYVLLLLPLMSWWRRAVPAIPMGWWVLLLGLPLGINEVMLKPLYPESHTLLSDWYTFNHYLLLTFYGFVLASARSAWDWLAVKRFWSLGAALIVTTGLLSLFSAGVIDHDTPIDYMLANVFTWTWLLAFLGLGREYLNFSNPLLGWAREASYPVYILHQTVIVVLAYYVVQQPWSPGSKYWLILLATLGICVVLYQWFVRRFAALRLLFGLKRAERSWGESGGLEARCRGQRP